VRGPVISEYGARRTGFHHGIDIRADHGTPVVASAAGVVAFAGWRSGYGNTVVLNHENEVHTLYGHLSRIRVTGGQKVRRGEVIALTGSTGRASTPHLHYEIRVRERPMNPRAFLPDPHRQAPKALPDASSATLTAAQRVAHAQAREGLRPEGGPR
jgi:murein DD-endopeptidase MepM/ murein hydrolase activator NlpD